MNRETREFITSIDGHSVVMKSWLTERENRPIQRFWASQTKISSDIRPEDIKDEDVKIDITNSPSAILEYYDVLTEAYVYSLDGDTNNICERLKDLRKEEFREVVDFINREIKLEKKTVSETPKTTGDSSISESQN
ncbi:MAG: hypothetical protein WCI36_03045 [bacterium]